MIDPTASLTAAAAPSSLTQIISAQRTPPRTVAELQAFELSLADALQQLMSPTLTSFNADDDNSETSLIPALNAGMSLQLQAALAAQQARVASLTGDDEASTENVALGPGGVSADG